MNFYTCVNRFGNNLLYRGYDNGKPVQYKIPFEPTLYELASRKTGIVSLDGKFLQPKSFTDMRTAKEHIQLQALPGGSKLYGNTNYVNQFLTEKFPNEIEFDRDKVNVTTILSIKDFFISRFN